MENFNTGIPPEAEIPVMKNVIDTNAKRISKIETNCKGAVMDVKMQNVENTMHEFKDTVKLIFNKMESMEKQIGSINVKMATIIGIGIALEAIIRKLF